MDDHAFLCRLAASPVGLGRFVEFVRERDAEAEPFVMMFFTHGLHEVVRWGDDVGLFRTVFCGVFAPPWGHCLARTELLRLRRAAWRRGRWDIVMFLLGGSMEA